MVVSFFSWCGLVYSIAKNVALARYRKDKWHSPLEEETLTRVGARTTERAEGSGHASWNPVEEVTRSGETPLVHEALEELSEYYREVIELRKLVQVSVPSSP